MKIWYNEESWLFNVKKTDTLEEVARKVIEEFNIEGVELKNFRFRAYDSRLKVKLGVFD